MVNLFKLTKFLLVLGIASYLTRWYFHYQVDLTQYRYDGWFGRKPLKAGKVFPVGKPDIRPFTINISEYELLDLKRRLTNVRYVDHIAGTHFNHGFNSVYLKHVVDYWRDKYNCRKEEEKLNKYPQFITQIEGILVHFVHVKSTENVNQTIIPILFIHGWPGSFFEYYKLIPLLTRVDENGLAFEVVIPSIPGFGYSEAPHKQGFNATAAARVFLKLMKRLGHDKFVVHGGNLGNVITRTMAILYPEHIIGAHILGNWDAIQTINSPYEMLKALFISYFPRLYFSFSDNPDFEYAKMFPLKSKLFLVVTERGYLYIQATKPDTIASALVDSPVGLAAYILEKFSTWTNPEYRNRKDGGLTEKFTLDELLTNIMIYWTSGNIAASQRFFLENLAEKDLRQNILSQKIKVAAGTVDAPNDLIRTPQKLVKKNYENLLQYSNLPRGGHFTAFEEPELVSADLRSFVCKVIDQQEHIKQSTKPKEYISKKPDDLLSKRKKIKLEF